MSNPTHTDHDKFINDLEKRHGKLDYQVHVKPVGLGFTSYKKRGKEVGTWDGLKKVGWLEESMSNPLIDAAVQALKDATTFRKETQAEQLTTSETFLSEANKCGGKNGCGSKKKPKKEVTEEAEQLEEKAERSLTQSLTRAKTKAARAVMWHGHDQGVHGLIKHNQSHSDETLSRLSAKPGEKRIKDSPADVQAKVIHREMKKRGMITKEDQDFIDLLNATSVEQLDELSKETLKSYISGAKDDKASAERMAKNDHAHGDALSKAGNKERGAAFKASAQVTREVAAKRGRGIALAAKKILAKA